MILAAAIAAVAAAAGFCLGWLRRSRVARSDIRILLDTIERLTRDMDLVPVLRVVDSQE